MCGDKSRRRHDYCSNRFVCFGLIVFAAGLAAAAAAAASFLWRPCDANAELVVVVVSAAAVFARTAASATKAIASTRSASAMLRESLAPIAIMTAASLSF